MAQIILTDLYIIFPPNAKYTFFSALHRTFPKTEHVLNNKTSLKRYKIIAIITWILSDHHGLKLDSTSETTEKNKQQKPYKLYRIATQLRQKQIIPKNLHTVKH